MLEKLRFWMHEHWFSFLILLIINLIVLTNSILQSPKVGYDVTLHLKYIQVLPLRLPTSQDTGEYFSAPLPYFIPSLFDKICVGAKWGNCVNRDGKFAQILNFFSIRWNHSFALETGPAAKAWKRAF